MPDYAEAKAREAAEREAREQHRQVEAQRRAAAQQQEIRREYTTSTTGLPNPYANYSTTRDTYPGESAQREAAQNAGQSSQPVQPAKADPRIGRNDPCPCGSGKKYKNCHGRDL